MSACVLWTGSIAGNGYGRVWRDGRHWQAHRVAYEAARGPIPEGLVIDHLCRTPLCVNPEHLEPVTPRENVLRGRSPAASHARKTHCPRGHAYTPENTYVNPRGFRVCRTCHAAADRRYRIERMSA